MIERTIIVIVSIAAIIFVPYWIGWLLVRPKSIEDNIVSNWWLGIIILMFLSLIVMGVKLYIIPYIINGSV
jgi:hypothetical protein